MKLFLLLFGLFSLCESYKILLFFPIPIKSLNILGEGYVRHLTKAGHQVTYVTAFPLKSAPDKLFRQVDVSKNLENFSYEELLNISLIMEQGTGFDDANAYQDFALDIATATFHNLKTFLSENNDFDVVISDLYESELFAGLSALYDCPMIWSYSMGAQWVVLRVIDEPSNPAYTVHYLSTNILPLNFLQRVEELWTQTKWHLKKRFVTLAKEKALYENTFGALVAKRGRTLPEYEHIIHNASLMLVNEHHAIGDIPKTPQNLRFVGGQHIESANALPEDLQSLMDNAAHGVIYFSMGSTWKSKFIPKHVTDSILGVFGELKQTVIWKYEADLEDLPPNVRTLKWAPQHGILSHPNCRFFISHGGLLSSTEAIHFGVPIIGVPVCFDQVINVNKAVSKGYGIKVNLDFELAENLKLAIQKMLNDKKYKEKVKELSAIYHDRVVPPGKELVHWVEHVVRTRGAPHLRSPALMVPWYQKMYLDLVVLIFIVLFTTKFLIAKLLSSVFTTKKVTSKKKYN